MKLNEDEKTVTAEGIWYQNFTKMILNCNVRIAWMSSRDVVKEWVSTSNMFDGTWIFVKVERFIPFVVVP